MSDQESARPTTGAYWNHLYDSGREYTLITQTALSTILSFTSDSLPKTCLDIGCGTGQLTRELYHRGYQCTGLDLSASAITIAASLTVVPHNELQYIRHDIAHDDLTKLPHGSYSIITCKLVYAFIPNKASFLERVRSLLTPGGTFVVVTPHTVETPPDRQGIAVADTDLALLATHFRQRALYKDSASRIPLIYFVGE